MGNPEPQSTVVADSLARPLRVAAQMLSNYGPRNQRRVVINPCVGPDPTVTAPTITTMHPHMQMGSPPWTPGTGYCSLLRPRTPACWGSTHMLT